MGVHWCRACDGRGWNQTARCATCQGRSVTLGGRPCDGCAGRGSIGSRTCPKCSGARHDPADPPQPFVEHESRAYRAGDLGELARYLPRVGYDREHGQRVTVPGIGPVAPRMLGLLVGLATNDAGALARVLALPPDSLVVVEPDGVWAGEHDRLVRLVVFPTDGCGV